MNRRRYAAHYLYHPGRGYLKQYVVEVEEGRVVRFFPLVEELEDVEWLPGLITLESGDADGSLIAYYDYPFDFTLMRPAAGTRRRPLP